MCVVTSLFVHVVVTDRVRRHWEAGERLQKREVKRIRLTFQDEAMKVHRTDSD